MGQSVTCQCLDGSWSMSSWSPYPNLRSMRKQLERVRMDFTKGKSCSGKLIAFYDSIDWKKLHFSG